MSKRLEIRLSDVSFSYKNNRVIDGLSLDVFSGITALMGPNGAGKTTLLNLISKRFTPDSGKIEFIKDEERGKEYGARVSLLPQSYDFVPGMKSLETVAHSAWSSGLGSRESIKEARIALSQVNMLDKAKVRVSALSGGQRQRLAIACAIVSGPDYLLLDEPSVGLDPVQRVALRELLDHISSSTSILLSTHLVDDVSKMASNIIVLNEGEAIFSGSKEEFSPEGEVEESYLKVIQRGVSS